MKSCQSVRIFWWLYFVTDFFVRVFMFVNIHQMKNLFWCFFFRSLIHFFLIAWCLLGEAADCNDCDDDSDRNVGVNGFKSKYIILELIARLMEKHYIRNDVLACIHNICLYTVFTCLLIVLFFKWRLPTIIHRIVQWYSEMTVWIWTDWYAFINCLDSNATSDFFALMAI